MTVAELIERLEEFPEDAEIELMQEFDKQYVSDLMDTAYSPSIDRVILIGQEWE